MSNLLKTGLVAGEVSAALATPEPASDYAVIIAQREEIAGLRKALIAALEAQPAEPVGFYDPDAKSIKTAFAFARDYPEGAGECSVPLYLHPPRAAAVPENGYVTRESAEAAINYLSLSNSAGREWDAMAMLKAAPPAPGADHE